MEHNGESVTTWEKSMGDGFDKKKDSRFFLSRSSEAFSDPISCSRSRILPSMSSSSGVSPGAASENGSFFSLSSSPIARMIRPSSSQRRTSSTNARLWKETPALSCAA